jgi:hypothetical protein
MVSKSKPSNKYGEQHLLMAGLPFILLKAKQDFKDPPSHYIMSSDTNHTSSPPSRMDMSRDLLALLKVNNIDIASLVPKIEFYKVVRSSDGKIKDTIFIPYAYDARQYAENIYGNASQRGDDVGIQNVSFVYDEQNPAVAETLLGCTIDFVFANAAALVTKRNRGQVVKGEDSGFRFADLFSFPSTKSSDAIDRDKYDIILKVGYQLDGIMKNQSHEVREALKKQDKMVSLGMINYDLTFEPNGMLKVSVQYKSSNLNYFSDKRNDIFGSAKKTLKYDPSSIPLVGPLLPSKKEDKKQVEKKKDVEQKQKKTEDSAQASPDDTKPAIDPQRLYDSLLDYLSENGKTYTFDSSLVDGIAKGDYYFSQNACFASNKKNDLKQDLSEALTKVGSSDIDSILKKFGDGEYQGKREIKYFYFGDLIEAIMIKNPEIFERMKARKFSFLMDNVAYQFIKGDRISVFNIAKLPIAVSFYNQWFTKNIIEKEKKIESLMSFMKGYVMNFAFAALAMRTKDQIGLDYTPTLVRRLINVPNGLEDNKEIFGYTKLDIKKNTDYYAKSAQSYHEYYTIYDESYYNDQLSSEMELIDDENRYYYNLAAGIPHFYIGANKGLLKKFSFQKSSIGEEIAVIRNLEEGTPTQQLWTIFDLNAEFIGNNIMSVGKNIYLDPTIAGLGSPLKEGTVSNIMGLGGYYMVSRVEHQYYPRWVTSISAIMISPASQKKGYSSEKGKFTYF